MRDDQHPKNKELHKKIQKLENQITALELSEQRFRATMKSIVDGMISADAEGNILQINPRAAFLTGWSKENAQNKPVTDVFKIIDESTCQCLENPLRSIIKSNSVIGKSTILVTKK